MLKIQKYLLEHDLEKTIEDFNLKSKFYENKILLKYDQLSSTTLMSSPEVQECRGLILERGTWKVMSLAFKKFFNSGEFNAHKIDWDTAHILEKLDGSCIQLYWDWHKETWFAGTTGTAEGEGEVNNKLGTTFNDLFWKTVNEKYNFKKENLNKSFCYVFELTTPYNIVVKPHGESSVSLLTVRNLETIEEVNFEAVTAIAKSLNVPIVKTYDLNAKNVSVLLNTFDNMQWTEEGYVVVDANFNRIKIKNPKYLAVHHLKGKTAEHNIIVIIKSNEIEEYVSTFPERKEELYKLKVSYDLLITKLNMIWDELQQYRPKNIVPSEKKKYAESVFELCEKHDVKNFSGLYFNLNDHKINSVEEFMINYDDKTLYKIL